MDARDACGCTALHRAAAQGHEGVVQHLLQHRAVASLAFQARPRLQELRLNVLPSSACPAKLCARRHRSAPQTKSMAHAPCLFICLSSEHPDLRLTRSAVPRTTAAHLAAWKGHSGALQLLLAAGADPDARDADGATPLHDAAAGAACARCLCALLAAGADPRARDRRGRTPAQLAAERGGGGEPVALLRAAEARGAARPGPGSRLGPGASAAPSAPPLPVPLCGAAGPRAYPLLHGSAGGAAASAGSAGAAVADPGGEQRPQGPAEGLLSTLASAAWLPARVAAGLAAHAAGWARWAAAGDAEPDSGCAGQSLPAAPAGAERGAGSCSAEQAAGGAGVGGQAGRVAADGRSAARRAGADGAWGAAGGAAPRRFGLPQGGTDSDSDRDADAAPQTAVYR